MARYWWQDLHRHLFDLPKVGVYAKRRIRWAHHDWDMLVTSGIDYITTQIRSTLSQINLKSTISKHKTQVCRYLFAPFTHHLRIRLQTFISVSLAFPAPADDDEHTPLSFASFCTFRGFSDKCGGDSPV